MKKDTTFEILFRITMHHMYDAERQIACKLAELAENAVTERLGNLLLEDREHAKQQINRLEIILDLIQNPKISNSAARLEDVLEASRSLLQGLTKFDMKHGNRILKIILEEGDLLLSQFSSTKAADMVVFGISQEIKHFEVASYKMLCQLASILNEKTVEDLLLLSLQEEIDMESRLQRMANEIGVAVFSD
ncbi:MAG: DUF892 family protein [Chlamydia sp.]